MLGGDVGGMLLPTVAIVFNNNNNNICLISQDKPLDHNTSYIYTSVTQDSYLGLGCHAGQLPSNAVTGYRMSNFVLQTLQFLANVFMRLSTT